MVIGPVKLSPKTPLTMKNPIMLGAMSGYTTETFVLEAAKAGVGAVSLGGFSVDEKTYEASIAVRGRGRNEFAIPPENLASYVNPQLDRLEKFNIPVFLNVRFVDPSSVLNFLEQLDFNEHLVLELNAHCRQPEVVAVDAGQALMRNKSLLRKLMSHLPPRQVIGLKIRGNDPNAVQFAELFGQLGGDVLHVDAYKAGKEGIATDLLKEVRSVFPYCLIGNNSVAVKEGELLAELLRSGVVDGLSVARAAIHDPAVPAQLWHELLKFLTLS